MLIWLRGWLQSFLRTRDFIVYRRRNIVRRRNLYAYSVVKGCPLLDLANEGENVARMPTRATKIAAPYI